MAFPFIGGKSRIGAWIFENMPQKKWDTYAEVFGGAMWVYMKRPIVADNVIYNDFNPFLYNVWACIAFHREELKEHLGEIKLNDKPTFHANKKFIKATEKEKEEFVTTIPNFEVAAKYIYLLTHCFSGDISGGMKLTENAWGPFNKKLRDQNWIKKFDSITKVENMDCIDLIHKYDGENTFFYVDPPYYQKEHLYGFHNFTKQKHYDLADVLKASKSSWILSYYDYDDLKHLYPEDYYTWLKKDYTRSSSAVPGKPGKGTEVLIFPKGQKEKRSNVNVFFR